MMWLTIYASTCIYAFLGSGLEGLMSAAEVEEEGIDVTHLGDRFGNLDRVRDRYWFRFRLGV
jgi:monoamine oxidase